MCVHQQLEKASSNFFWEVNCAFFFFFFLKTSCCIYIHLSARQKPHTGLFLKLQRLSFTDFAWFSFLSFCEGKMSFYKLGGCQATPNSSLTKRQRAEDHKQNHSMSSVRNRQPNLFHMEEQMSFKLILDTEIKIWFKISVSKI